MIPSVLVNFLSNLSKSAGLHPNVAICILVFLILILITTGIILLKLRRAERVLNAVEREMDAFERSLGRSSSGIVSPNIHPSKGSPDGVLDKTADNQIKDGIFEKTETVSNGMVGLTGDVSKKRKDHLAVEKPHTRPAIGSEQDLPSLKNDSGLKEKIHDLIRNSDQSISLKDLVKELYQKNFDGNYDPILSDLDQLEREGKIEGQVINGKIFFRMKQKTPRKYTIRKGKNFRKYFD